MTDELSWNCHWGSCDCRGDDIHSWNQYLLENDSPLILEFILRSLWPPGELGHASLTSLYKFGRLLPIGLSVSLASDNMGNFVFNPLGSSSGLPGSLLSI